MERFLTDKIKHLLRLETAKLTIESYDTYTAFERSLSIILLLCAAQVLKIVTRILSSFQ